FDAREADDPCARARWRRVPRRAADRVHATPSRERPGWVDPCMRALRARGGARSSARAPAAVPRGVTGQTVAWIGLGEMGLPMARHLVRAGHRVVGFDIDATRLEAASALGVEPAGSAAAAAVGAALVVTMLRTGAQTEELVTGLASGLALGPAI